MESLDKVNTLDELSKIKESFISECKKREQKILVSNVLGKIENFSGAQSMFESLIIPLMKYKNGKQLINRYVSVIKENKSLKTLYAYREGLKENSTPESKKAYIKEALSLTEPVCYDEYVKGVGEIVGLISEAFKVVGDEYVLENVQHDEVSNSIGDSLLYLSTTTKDIKNLNEYISHIENVSEVILENKKCDIDVNLTLDKIVEEIKEKSNKQSVSDIFETVDKEKAFCDAKNECLALIKEKKDIETDVEIINKLLEMEDRLNKKLYNFGTFTKDMLHMTELKEVLN